MLMEKHTLLKNIPSGSGLAVQNHLAYVIGDDATAVYTLYVDDLRNSSSFPINGLNSSLYREPKESKHDYEAATFGIREGKQYLMVLGSGTNFVSRDSLLLINTARTADQKTFSLETFYKKLMQSTNTDISQWNIEGAAVIEGMLYLGNRGNNMIVWMKVDDFFQYLDDPSKDIRIGFDHLKLSPLQGKTAGLSGLCALGKDELVFTASIEDTPNWMVDGPVLGSYVGIYSLSKSKVINYFLLKDDAGNTLKEKLESVEVISDPKENNTRLIALSDNDDGSSKLFYLTLWSN